MRWDEGVRGLRREREPVVEVTRRDLRLLLLMGEEGEGGRRVIVVGKAAVWKDVCGRRRWPERDLESADVLVGLMIGGKRRRLTFRIELQDVEIRIRVRDHEIQLFAVWEEIGGEDFDVGGGFPEEAELVGVLLYVFR